MISTSGLADQVASARPIPVWRISVEKYEEMVRTGVIAEDDRVELLDGLLMEKMPVNPPHSVATELARRVLDRRLPEGWHTRSQQPVALSTSEPEPDVALVRGGERDYATRHPGPHDLALVVEVADASLDNDRTLKKPIYAADRIPVYWIVNLVDQRLEEYREPNGSLNIDADYRTRRDYGPDDSVPLLIDGREVARFRLADILP